MGRFHIEGQWYDAPNYAEAKKMHLTSNPQVQKPWLNKPQPGHKPPNLNEILRTVSYPLVDVVNLVVSPLS